MNFEGRDPSPSSEQGDMVPWRYPARRGAVKTYSRASRVDASKKSPDTARTVVEIKSSKGKFRTSPSKDTKVQPKGKQNPKAGVTNGPQKEKICMNCDRTFKTSAGLGKHSRSCKPKRLQGKVEQKPDGGKNENSKQTEISESEDDDVIITHSLPSDKQCSNCPRTFDSLTGLRRHSRTCRLKPPETNINKNLTPTRSAEAEQQVLQLKSKFENLAKLKSIKSENQCSNCSRTFETLAGLCRHSKKCNSKSSDNNGKKKLKASFHRTGKLNDGEEDHPLKEVILDEQTENSNERTSSQNGNHCRNCARTFDTMPGLRRHLRTCKIKLSDEGNSSFEGDESPSQEEVPNADSENSAPQKGNPCPHCPRNFTTLAGLCRHSRKCKSKASEIDMSRTSNSTKNNQTLEEFLNLDDKFGVMDKSKYEIVAVETCHCCGEDLLTAHSMGDYQCNECQKLFQLKSSLERHLNVVHQAGESHECPQCGAKCPDKGTLARHMYTHTGLKPYSCPVCKQEFSRKYHLVRHNMQTGCDGKEKPVFPCQVCGRVFNRKDNLREHLRAHAGQTKRKKIFACDTCGMEFCGTNLLQSHKRSHTGEKPYCCDFCPKRFTSSGALKKHRRTHTGEKPYECQTCQKRFAAKETLNRHIRIHTGFKPHCCQFCGKRFIQSSQLRSHLFYHTGQSVLRPGEAYTCDLCSKKFNRRTRLNEHIKFVHLGAKPFECAQCPKTFIRKEDLNRHLIIHSGVKSHVCPICGKAFAMKSSLKVHLLTHTKEPPRSCDECGRAFIRQDCLLRHMRNKHRDMLEEIMCEAEKKKLQQQLLQVAAEASMEGLQDKQELDGKELSEAVRELLTLLVDEATLRGLGWPTASVEALLEAVIVRCGHDPAPPSVGPPPDRLRLNIKLLFTVVINDSAIKALLNNQTVDEVVLHVLRLAKP